MFNKMTETAKTAGLDKQKGCEPGQIDERKNMKGPDPFDGQEKRYSECEILLRIISTTLFYICFKIILDPQVIVKSIIDPMTLSENLSMNGSSLNTFNLRPPT